MRKRRQLTGSSTTCTAGRIGGALVGLLGGALLNNLGAFDLLNVEGEPLGLRVVKHVSAIGLFGVTGMVAGTSAYCGRRA